MTRKVNESALKHGIGSEDSLHVAENPEYAAYLDAKSPARQLLLGFDREGRLLELVLLTFDSGDEMIIHAMPARAQYRKLLG